MSSLPLDLQFDILELAIGHDPLLEFSLWNHVSKGYWQRCRVVPLLPSNPSYIQKIKKAKNALGYEIVGADRYLQSIQSQHTHLKKVRVVLFIGSFSM